MTFAEKLLKLRKDEGFSQESLAERLDVSRQAVSRWESGAALPDAPNLVKLSRIFAVSIDYLLRDEMESDTAPSAATGDEPRFYQDRLVSGLGRCLLVLGTLGFAGLAMGSALSPADVIDLKGNHFSGLWGFLKFHDLEWAFYLTLALFMTGLLAAIWPLGRRSVGKWLYSRKPD